MTNMTSKLIASLAILSATCLTVPTAFAQPAAGGKKAKPVIGVSLLTLSNPFFVDLGNAIKDAAAARGMEAIIVAGEFDMARQRNQVADFLVKRVDAIVLCPCDSKAIGTSIQEANKAGIPVFTADIASMAQNAKVVTHVATDNLGGGKEAAKAIIEALNGNGKVAILDYPEVESVLLRTRGFDEVIAAYNASGAGKITIVTRLPGGGAKEKSFATAQDILQAYPDLDGIFAINDPSALGAVAALEKAGRLGRVKVVGFDGMPEGKKAIKDGKIYADPIQFPDRIGKQTVAAIVKYLDGEDVPAQTLIPTELYRKADADKDPTVK